MARLTASLHPRSAKLEVLRKIDFEVIVFAYFLGYQVHLEFLGPGPRPVDDPETAARPSSA
jgi:hypothetical protein